MPLISLTRSLRSTLRVQKGRRSQTALVTSGLKVRPCSAWNVTSRVDAILPTQMSISDVSRLSCTYLDDAWFLTLHLLSTRPYPSACVSRLCFRLHLQTPASHSDFSDHSSRVLRGLNIEVKPGQFVALVGPSGCGKVRMPAKSSPTVTLTQCSNYAEYDRPADRAILRPCPRQSHGRWKGHLRNEHSELSKSHFPCVSRASTQ